MMGIKIVLLLTKMFFLLIIFNKPGYIFIKIIEITVSLVIGDYMVQNYTKL